jgi:hypothetical protein
MFLTLDVRTNWIYIRVYILWMNMIVMILVPFVLLFYLNLQVTLLFIFNSNKLECLYHIDIEIGLEHAPIVFFLI